MTRRKWAGRHRKVPIGQIKGISKHTIAKLASHTHTGRIASRVVHTVRINHPQFPGPGVPQSNLFQG
jgi:hypothetical protein